MDLPLFRCMGIMRVVANELRLLLQRRKNAPAVSETTRAFIRLQTFYTSSFHEDPFAFITDLGDPSIIVFPPAFPALFPRSTK